MYMRYQMDADCDEDGTYEPTAEEIEAHNLVTSGWQRTAGVFAAEDLVSRTPITLGAVGIAWSGNLCWHRRGGRG